MKWTRRDDGSYISDAGYVVYRNGGNWVSNRSDAEPIPGHNVHTWMDEAKKNCERDHEMQRAQAPAPEVTFSLYFRQTTTDYVIRGAEPIRSLLGSDAMMLPERVRVNTHDGSATAFIYGPKLSAGGKVLKTHHSRPVDPGDDDAPEWFKRLMDYEAMIAAHP